MGLSHYDAGRGKRCPQTVVVAGADGSPVIEQVFSLVTVFLALFTYPDKALRLHAYTLTATIDLRALIYVRRS
jgi:hypothetical protein